MKNKIILVLIMVLIALQVAFASVDVGIDIKQKFTEGERISFNYTITSTEDLTIFYTPLIECPAVPQGILQIRLDSLEENIPYINVYDYIQVTEDIISQDCIASISIQEPIQQIFEEEFSIETMPLFSFSIILDKKVFILNEDINLDYSSSVSDPNIKAALIYPDGETEEINLPSTITASQIGTYTLEITASKEGYKTITKTEQFGVIEKAVQIKDASVCEVDGVCEGDETYKNCPQDCGQETAKLVDKVPEQQIKEDIEYKSPYVAKQKTEDKTEDIPELGTVEPEETEEEILYESEDCDDCVEFSSPRRLVYPIIIFVVLLVIVYFIVKKINNKNKR